MKKYYSLILLFLFVLGCSDNPGLVELSDDNNQINFITTESSALQQPSMYKIIEGEVGGEFNFDLDSESFKAKGSIEFPTDCFSDQKQIVVTLPKTENNYAVIDLNPDALKLNRPVCMTLKFSELNIQEGDIINFSCTDESGNLTEVDYGRLIINYEEDWALVVNAKIYNLARVGFTVGQD